MLQLQFLLLLQIEGIFCLFDELLGFLSSRNCQGEDDIVKEISSMRIAVDLIFWILLNSFVESVLSITGFLTVRCFCF